MNTNEALEVNCHRVHTGSGKWSWVNGAPNEQTISDAKLFGWRIELSYSDKALTTLQATVERLEGELERYKGYRQNWVAMSAEFEHRAEAAERDLAAVRERCEPMAREMVAVLGPNAPRSLDQGAKWEWERALHLAHELRAAVGVSGEGE